MAFGRTSARCLLMLATAVIFVLFSDKEAEACACVGWTTFDQASRAAPFVVLGRVEAVGPTAKGEPTDPTFIDVAIERVTKGRLRRDRVRVWNDNAGTSCGGAFTKTPAGTRLRIALRPVVLGPAKEEEELDRNYWSFLGFKPPVGDYLATTGCANGFVVLESPR